MKVMFVIRTSIQGWAEIEWWLISASVLCTKDNDNLTFTNFLREYV